MSLLNLICVCSGASAGAACRWLITSLLNPVCASLAPGTLAVNWIGSLVMGIIIGIFAHVSGINPAWRLFLVTGFLGSFTTFSAFSAEVGAQILAGRLGLAALTVSLHVIGSLALFFVGLWIAGGIHRLGI